MASFALGVWVGVFLGVLILALFFGGRERPDPDPPERRRW